MTDLIKEPPHYTDGGIETIDYIRAKLTPEGFRGFLTGNILKYMSRAGKKGKASEDHEKAAVYLGWLKELPDAPRDVNQAEIEYYVGRLCHFIRRLLSPEAHGLWLADTREGREIQDEARRLIGEGK
jgi:hypothetical protein